MFQLFGINPNKKLRTVSVRAASQTLGGELAVCDAIEESYANGGISVANNLAVGTQQITAFTVPAAYFLTVTSLCALWLGNGTMTYGRLLVSVGGSLLNLVSTDAMVIRRGLQFSGNVFIRSGDVIMVEYTVTGAGCNTVMSWTGVTHPQ